MYFFKFTMMILLFGLLNCQNPDDDKEFCALFEPDEIVDDLSKRVEKEVPRSMKLPRVNWFITLQDGIVHNINALVRGAKTESRCTKDHIFLRVSLVNNKLIEGSYKWNKRLIGNTFIAGTAKTWVRRMDLKLDIKAPFDLTKPTMIKALDVDSFKGVEVKIYGLGVFSNSASKIATELANQFKHQIVVIVEKMIARMFTRDLVKRLTKVT